MSKWTVRERMEELKKLFQHLEKTPSRNLKLYAIDAFRQGMGTQASEDLDYCLEILDGRWKTGYTFLRTSWHYQGAPSVAGQANGAELSLEEFLRPVMNPASRKEADIVLLCRKYAGFQDFIAPLVNREWRLGIGKSLLGTKEVSPMLGKKYDYDKTPASTQGYYVTEKLDGNRCLAQYSIEQGRWVFTSRSGKEMRVQFDMKDFPKEYIYDGEVLSESQIHNPGQANFNALSGVVNSKHGDKSSLVYVIFDIVLTTRTYHERRMILEDIRSTRIEKESNTKILKVLQYLSMASDLYELLPKLLDSIVKAGGEGLMLNIGSRRYEQKRTDAILKVKQTQTMDMRVTGLSEGTGKHESCVGALFCECEGDDGKIYECRVGSGLSDEQRARWADYPEEIVGHIVEVAYFSISQDKASRGSKYYSLRFPRLKQVRDDKEATSEY